MAEIPEDGIHLGVPAELYHSWPALNFSSLVKASKSPLHYYWDLTHPADPTPAMQFGTAFHTCVLEPEAFERDYAKAPAASKRTKAGRQTWEEFELSHPNCTVLTPNDYDLCVEMRDAILAHPMAHAMLSDASGLTEASVVWTDEDGTRCKARTDKIITWGTWTHIIDLKTTTDASKHGFAKAIGNYRYDWQAAHYIDGLDWLKPRERKFTWIAIEKEPPYGIGIYELEGWCLDEARDEIRETKQLIKQALEKKDWGGYPAEIVTLTTPRWRQVQREY